MRKLTSLVVSGFLTLTSLAGCGSAAPGDEVEAEAAPGTLSSKEPCENPSSPAEGAGGDPSSPSEPSPSADPSPSSDPFEESSCSGPTISKTRLQELTANGSIQYLGSGTMWTRRRNCNEALGCGPWFAQEILGGVPDGASTSQTPSGNIVRFTLVDLVPEKPPAPNNTYERYYFFFNVAPADPTSEIVAFQASHQPDWSTSWHDVEEESSVTFTDHCLRARALFFRDGPQYRLEREVVYLRHF